MAQGSQVGRRELALLGRFGRLRLRGLGCVVGPASGLRLAAAQVVAQGRFEAGGALLVLGRHLAFRNDFTRRSARRRRRVRLAISGKAVSRFRPLRQRIGRQSRASLHTATHRHPRRGS
ncbi:hypothetical protein Mext_1988 [Methylorubrum extorquens PA1]|nr:hypothetical protein Mext_1988 [Methylorubrum extorquens PA1]